MCVLVCFKTDLQTLSLHLGNSNLSIPSTVISNKDGTWLWNYERSLTVGPNLFLLNYIHLRLGKEATCWNPGWMHPKSREWHYCCFKLLGNCLNYYFLQQHLSPCFSIDLFNKLAFCIYVKIQKYLTNYSNSSVVGQMSTAISLPQTKLNYLLESTQTDVDVTDPAYTWNCKFKFSMQKTRLHAIMLLQHQRITCDIILKEGIVCFHKVVSKQPSFLWVSTS